MPHTISTDDLKAKIDNGEEYWLIDVLSPESYQYQHLPTAINMPNGTDLPDQAAEQGIRKDAEMIVYCSSRSCGASQTAAIMLEQAGYSNVVDFEDGLVGWQEAGYELVSQPKTTKADTDKPEEDGACSCC